MADTKQTLKELREAERHLARALQHAGMARGTRGYISPAVSEALEDVQRAIQNIEGTRTRRRGWSRLARTS